MCYFTNDMQWGGWSVENSSLGLCASIPHMGFVPPEPGPVPGRCTCLWLRPGFVSACDYDRERSSMCGVYPNTNSTLLTWVNCTCPRRHVGLLFVFRGIHSLPRFEGLIDFFVTLVAQGCYMPLLTTGRERAMLLPRRVVEKHSR